MLPYRKAACLKQKDPLSGFWLPLCFIGKREEEGRKRGIKGMRLHRGEDLNSRIFVGRDHLMLRETSLFFFPDMGIGLGKKRKQCASQSFLIQFFSILQKYSTACIYMYIYKLLSHGRGVRLSLGHELTVHSNDLGQLDYTALAQYIKTRHLVADPIPDIDRDEGIHTVALDQMYHTTASQDLRFKGELGGKNLSNLLAQKGMEKEEEEVESHICKGSSNQHEFAMHARQNPPLQMLRRSRLGSRRPRRKQGTSEP